jgi:hypothetical protein
MLALGFHGAPGRRRGSSSELMRDVCCAAHMTRFWIMQLAGKKLLRLFPPSENWRADATDGGSFQPSLYTIDLLRPDYDAHPNMKVRSVAAPD